MPTLLPAGRAALAVLLVVTTAAAQSPKNDPPRLVAKTASAHKLAELAEACRGIGFSGAVLAARGGKVQIALGIGKADDETANTARTLYELASATKQFTATAILWLAEKKKLKLDDPIARHLPNVPANCEGITVRHLIQHTSGIPDTNASGSGRDLDKLVPRMLQGGPKHEPGTHWEYWNAGYALLAGIIEERSGIEYAAFCRKHLFARAKMKTACFTGDKAPRGYPVAMGASKKGARSALDHPYGEYGFQYMGMGGAVANVWDLWRWDRALRGTKVLKKASLRELFEAGLEDYALGWMVKERDGRVVQSHGGDVRGFHCELRRYPKQNGCLFVLGNGDGSNPRPVADLLERALFGERVDAPPRPIEAALQKQLAGAYVDATGNRLVIEADGDITRTRMEWKNPSYPPGHASVGQDKDGDLIYFESAQGMRLGIKRDTNGGIVQVTLRGKAFLRQ